MTHAYSPQIYLATHSSIIQLFGPRHPPSCNLRLALKEMAIRCLDTKAHPHGLHLCSCAPLVLIALVKCPNQLLSTSSASRTSPVNQSYDATLPNHISYVYIYIYSRVHVCCRQTILAWAAKNPSPDECQLDLNALRGHLWPRQLFVEFWRLASWQCSIWAIETCKIQTVNVPASAACRSLVSAGSCDSQLTNLSVPQDALLVACEV